MPSIPQISIKRYVGTSQGIAVTLPLDWVYAHKAGGAVRIGLVGTHEGGTVRFLRWLQPEMREEIRKRVAELRKQQGGNGISPFTVSIPDPRLIRGYLKGERYRKRPTVTQVPAGVPEGSQRERKQRLYVPGGD